VAKRRSRKTSSSTIDPVTAYARAVVAGEKVVGPDVYNACVRHLDDIEDGPARGLKWEPEQANHVIRFFREKLRVDRTAADEGEGTKPFDLIDWQAFVVGSLFGWKAPDGTRRFRMAFIETGKGSGKSPLAAGIGLYMLTADSERRAEVYAAATKIDQAKVLFRDAVAMVETSPDLDERLLMSGGTNKTNIAYLRYGSFFRPISTEDRGKGQSGPRPHCALLDEIHEHPTNAMVEFMRAGTKGRRQALIFMITNSGSDRESVCYDYHDYGVKVCAGDIEDDSFFAFICSLDEDDEPLHDPSCWPKANPSLGITFQPKYLEEQVRHALGMPSKQNLVLRLNFCRWTDAESAWISREAWMACERILDRKEFGGRECYGALDLSGRRDLTAYAEVFPNADGTMDAFLEFWTPKDTLKEREDEDRVPYIAWARDGHLHAVPGKVIDYAHVVKRLGERSAEVEILEVAYDRWRIENLKADLDEQGIVLNLVECGQGFKDMSPAVEVVEEAILNGMLRVHANPVLRWNVASAVLDEDAAGNRKFTKRKATGRIDGLVALAMAVRLAALNIPEEVAEPQAVWL